MPEFRPCIVTEYINKLYPSESLTCRIEVKPEVIKHNALFHCWSGYFCSIDHSSVIKECTSSQGQIFHMVAIVEYEDGTIHEHSPWTIQFTDDMVEKFRKNKKDGWNTLTETKDSYPKTNEHVLFKTKDGRIFYGICGIDLDWSIEIEEGIIKIIKDVVEWREIQL